MNFSGAVKTVSSLVDDGLAAGASSLAGSETNSGLLNRSGVGCHLKASGAFGGPVTKTIGGAVGGNVGGFGHAAVTVGQAVLVSVRMGRGVSALDGSGFQDSVAGEGATNSSEAALDRCASFFTLAAGSRMTVTTRQEIVKSTQSIAMAKLHPSSLRHSPAISVSTGA